MKIVVGIADMRVSKDPTDTLVTFSLGSCIGLSVYDPVAHVGGLLHFMLPEKSLDPEKAVQKPFMFCDTGVPLLFKSCYALGAQKSRMIVKAAGGAQILDDNGYFNIGKRNHMMLRKLLWKNNVLISAEAVGGNVNRTMYLDIRDGRSWIKLSGKDMVEL